MATLIIQGGRRLTGDYVPSGNKNAVLPMIAAALLTDEPVTVHNVPQIADVRVMLQLLESLGVEIRRQQHSVEIRAGTIKKCQPDAELCHKVRSSILLAGPLAARHGRAILAPPGGDVIGRRRLDPHWLGLQALGIRVTGGRNFILRRSNLKAADILLDEASVTATENVLMAATLAPGTTTIRNAACEPHVVDLGRLLCKMGAQIEGLGTNRLIVKGVKALKGAEHTAQPDHIEIGSFIAAAAATGGSLRVPAELDPEVLLVIQRAFRKLGVKIISEEKALTIPPLRHLRIRSDFGRAIPKIEDGVWPAFPSDLMSVSLVLATQAHGQALFFEKLFESRLYFVDRLIEMGAHIVPCDPHRVVVMGPSRLRGTHLTTPDIRAGMALIVAALCARGESRIDHAEIVDRGYEALDERLRALGADIERCPA